MKSREMTQADLARAAGVSKGAVNHVINGNRQPGIDFCRGIAKAFQLPEETVFIQAGLMTPKSDYDPEWEEWKLMLSKLSDENSDTLFAIGRTLLEKQENYD